MDPSLSLFELWLLALTGAAATLDARSGLIPNWLTLPSLSLAPLAHALSGPGALGWSLASAFVCAAGPILLFSRGAMGGGDVKLFAAVGAIAGARAGLELQLVGYIVAAFVAVCCLGVRRQLWGLLRRAFALLIGWAFPRARRAAPAAGELIGIRLGVPVFMACAGLTAIRKLGL